MSIIKIKRTLKKEMGLKKDSIHISYLLNIYEAEHYIQKDVEVEFQINGRFMILEWIEEGKKKSHKVSKSFINEINNFLEKPLPNIR